MEQLYHSEMRDGTPSLLLQETMQIANEELAQLLKEKNQQLDAERDELLAKVSEFKLHDVRRRQRSRKVINDQRTL